MIAWMPGGITRDVAFCTPVTTMLNRSFFLLLLSLPTLLHAQTTWKRHTIDERFRGADGVRLADFNGDGLQDVVTGWEESGTVRLYLNPGPAKATQKWPAVTVGEGLSPEDAVPFDFDADGHMDVVSCHEGKLKRVLVHFNRGGDLLDESNWESRPIESLDGERWMFAVPIEDIDGASAIVLGSKDRGASITVLTVPTRGDRRDLSRVSVHPIRVASWIMSLRTIDMDSDGDLDVVYSDRKGKNRGVGWLERPNQHAATGEWTDHRVGGSENEVMFMDADKDRFLVATRNTKWLDFRRTESDTWDLSEHPNPPNVPNGKAIVRLGDTGLVMTSNTAISQRLGQIEGVWLSTDGNQWSPISETKSVKLDRMECLDLDGDGDLDVMTCEERKNLGVIWYENPER